MLQINSMNYTTDSVRKRALGSIPPTLVKFFNKNLFEPLPKPKSGEWLKSARQEQGQTFEAFQSVAVKSDSNNSIIYVLPLDDIPDSMLNYLYQYCSGFFLGVSVEILPKKNLDVLQIENRMNCGVKQYHAGRIIESLKIPKGGYCLIAITMQDLYPRDSWNFVFGLANGKRGVFSFARFYEVELNPNDADELRLYRAARTMTHEICHMFGIKHCVYYKCLMNGSNSLEESAGKPAHLCCVCLHKLYNSLRFDLRLRYERLMEITDREYIEFQKQVTEYRKLLAG